MISTQKRCPPFVEGTLANSCHWFTIAKKLCVASHASQVSDRTILPIFIIDKQTVTCQIRGSPIGFFYPVIPTQNFRQFRNPEGYFWHPTSHAYFQSQISPRFGFKIPNPEPQIREIPHPEKLIGDPQIKWWNFTSSPPFLCLKLSLPSWNSLQSQTRSSD